MTDESKRRLRRDFVPRGAFRRGVLWVVVCLAIAYAPAVVHAATNTS